MNIQIKNIPGKDCACDALILPFIEGQIKPSKDLGASVAALLRKISPDEFSGKKNEVLLLPAPADIKPGRLLLLGLGEKEKIGPEVLRQAGGKALAHLRTAGIREVALSLPATPGNDLSAVYFIEGGLLGLYTYDLYKTEKETREIRKITLLSKPLKALSDGIRTMEVLASAVCFARDLVNAPSNTMTPTHLAGAALALGGKDVSVTVLERKDAEKLGMGAYLSVSKGSDEPPKFIVLEYRGSKKDPLILIGKSVTFDSGGLSIKPSDGLEKMKYDMAGGAAVLGLIRAVSLLRLPVHIIGILPATENLPGGSATRPGDVVRTLGGMTVEIINTDAEGRLTLADALGYAKRFKPHAVIDIATLTGACAIAFGGEAVAMMGNNRSVMEVIKESADFVNERVWEMPLFDEYREYLKSDVADIKNIGGRTGSLATSAKFLSEFAGDTPWAHLDIAGTAWTEKDKPYTPKGASGIGVRLLFDIIRRMQ